MFDTFTQKFPRDYTAAYTNMPFKWPLKFHIKSGSGQQSLKILKETGPIKLYGVWSYMVTINKSK